MCIITEQEFYHTHNTKRKSQQVNTIKWLEEKIEKILQESVIGNELWGNNPEAYSMKAKRIMELHEVKKLLIKE